MFSKKSDSIKLPGYLKYFVILSSLVLTCYLLYLGRAVVNPLITALIVALIIKPMAAKVEDWGASRGVASIFAILIIFILLAILSIFFSIQVNNIVSDLDAIGERFSQLIDKSFHWIDGTFGVKPEQQIDYLKNSLDTMLRNSGSFFSSTLSATASFVSAFVLFLIALFFILYYRSFFKSFLFRLVREDNKDELKETIVKVEGVVRNYILGLFLVILIIATLNTVGLFALGIEHAIFFGVLAALLTVIPYVGVFVGSLLPALFAFITKDSLWYPLGVLGMFGLVQFSEGNFITPQIVGDRVSINPFAAIMSLFLGGIILGTIGLIFAIPLLAIIKVICDSVEYLKPIGYILGSPPEDLEKKRRFKGLKKARKKARH